MGNLFRAIAVGLLALPLSSCSEYRQLRITGTLDRPAVSVVRPGSDQALRACVDWIAVFDGERGRGVEGAIWRVRSPDDRCIDIGPVTYGETPDGFVVDTPPQPLRADTVYAASGHGWTGGFASVPWYGGGRFMFRDEVWQSVPY